MSNFVYRWTSADQSPWSAPLRPEGLDQGRGAQREGRLGDAWRAYVKALRQRPHRALASYLLGRLQVERGMGLSSVPFLLRAHLLQPSQVEYVEALLFARLRSGQIKIGQALLEAAEADALPFDPQPWRNWLAQYRAGEVQANLPLLHFPAWEGGAEPPDPADPFVTHSPLHAGLREPFTVALQHYQRGDFAHVVAELDNLLPTHANWGEGHHLRGMALFRLGRIAMAETSLLRAKELISGRPDVWDHLALVLAAMGLIEESDRAFEMALALNPLRSESWNNASTSAIAREEYDGGFQYAYLANQLDPDLLPPVYNLARAALGRGEIERSQTLFSRLLEAYPEHGMAEQQLGDLCILKGDYAAALTHYQRAIDINPEDWLALSGFIFVSHYLASQTPAQIYQMALAFGALLGRDVIPRTTWPNSREQGRKLRVGFVSGDLREHPVGYFFLSVAEALAIRPDFELFAYPTTRRRDEMTERFQPCFGGWTSIAGLNDDEAADRISADGIDILVDLSGHTGGQRLGVFCRQVAPVQLTWLGYFGTTGLSQIDYILTGPRDIAPDEEAFYTEKVWRLPHTRLCFSRPTIDVGVAPPPSSQGEPFTFGCFNTIRKINDRVIGLWTAILMAMPEARLFLKAAELGSEEARLGIQRRFERLGVDPGRIIFEGPTPMRHYLEAYSRLDLALDPFPYTGGTTSVQALWMGVPVLTLAGDRFLARQGEGILHALDLGDWIAVSEDDYLKRAIDHAGDLAALGALRLSLRQRLEASALMNPSLFAADLSLALRGIWRQWCQRD